MVRLVLDNMFGINMYKIVLKKNDNNFDNDQKVLKKYFNVIFFLNY